MKHISIFICLLCYLLPLSAQNTLSNQYGTSASGRSLGAHDRNGNPIDTTAVTDANSIPIGLYQWKVTRRLGNIIPVPVDTLQAGFKNSNDPAGPTGQYNYLGNLGTHTERQSWRMKRRNWYTGSSIRQNSGQNPESRYAREMS